MSGRESNELCPPVGWENKRDERLTKDKRKIMIEYWANNEGQVSYIFCKNYPFRRIIILSEEHI